MEIRGGWRVPQEQQYQGVSIDIDVGTQSMITAWKTICEEFRNWNLAQEGMKLNPARKKSARRQKHSVDERGGAGRGLWGRGGNRRER